MTEEGFAGMFAELREKGITLKEVELSPEDYDGVARWASERPPWPPLAWSGTPKTLTMLGVTIRRAKQVCPTCQQEVKRPGAGE